MPSYSYTIWDENGERVLTVERVFPMDAHPDHIMIDGSKAVRDVAADWAETPTVKCWEPGAKGRTSMALGIHPKDLKQYQEFDKAMGVPTDYVPSAGGTLLPDFTSRAHRKRYGRAHTVRDRNGGYGDA